MVKCYIAFKRRLLSSASRCPFKKQHVKSYFGAEQLGPEQRPLACDGQVDADALGRAAASQHGPLSRQPLRQLAAEESEGSRGNRFRGVALCTHEADSVNHMKTLLYVQMT